MRIFAVFFLLGTLIIQFFQQLPPLIWIGLFLSISIFLTIFLNKKSVKLSQNFQNPIIQSLTTASSAFLLGLLLSTSVAQNQLTKRLASELEGQDILLQGRVVGVPNARSDGARFRFKIETASLKTEPERFLDLNGIVRLGWFQNQQVVNADERWQLMVRMKRPSGFLNPGGFDYEKWLFTERITATGYIRKSPELNKKLADSPWWSINHLRQNIHQKIQQGVEDKTSAAVLSALVVAIRMKLDDTQWQQLQQTGTSHLVAISGLHIAVVAGFAFLPILFIWGLFPSLNERVPMRVAGAVAGVVFASVYAMLAGFTLPTQRALLMVVIALVGLLLRKNYQASTILAVAVVAVLLLDPLAGMTVSFWLSFLAVALILIFLKRQIEKPTLQLIKLQMVLSLAMLPLTLFFFGTASLVSPLANLVAIPWVSLVVVPLSLIALVFMPISSVFSNGLFSMAALAVKWLFMGFDFLSQFSIANVTLAEIPSSYLIIAFLGLLSLLLPKGFPARWLGLIALLPALLFSAEKPKHDEFIFTLLDAGQGMASVVQTASHTLVYDTGTRYSETYDIGKLVVVPFLKSKGITTLDSLMISHNDIDHRGGAETTLKNITTKQILSSDLSVLDENEYKVKNCIKGMQWQWDGVDFEILSPPENYDENDNNLSCVLRVSNKYHSLLLTGDIQRKTERNLLQDSNASKVKLDVDVITVPHHGSKTSSSEAFIQATSPALALVPAGYRNRFGHPKEKVLTRYKELGVEVLDTANSGAITIDFPADSGDFDLQLYRKIKKGFWSR